MFIEKIRDSRLAKWLERPYKPNPDQIRNFAFQIKNPIAPTSTELIGQGKAKLIYAGQIEQGSSKTPDIIYMISRNRFFNGELKGELIIAPEIQKGVYLANLEKFIESLGQPRRKAKPLAGRLSRLFPTLEALVKAFLTEDPVLNRFFLKHSLKAWNWGSPEMKRLVDSCLHLSVDLVYAPSILIHGRESVLAKRAECDLEQAIRKRRHLFLENKSLVRQLFLGFRDLHAGGYIHGDPKLENVLLYRLGGKPIVKIADWGKCKKLLENEVAIHTGNRRHMAPERLASQKGEVFGVGIMAVRILEEEFLSEGPDAMLVSPEKIDPGKEKFVNEHSNSQKSRKGIERYLSIAKGCPEIDATWGDTMNHMVGSLKSYLFHFHPRIDTHVEKYLNALGEKLKGRYGDTKEISQWIDLLKAMMRSKEKRRITMEEVVSRLEKISAGE